MDDMTPEQKLIAQLREALESVQWGSCDRCGQKVFCPECGAYRYDEDYEPGEHEPGCRVGDALRGC